MNSEDSIAKIYVKYPKGFSGLAHKIKPQLKGVHPNCQIILHRLTDKRGVHSSCVAVCIICKPVVFSRFFAVSQVISQSSDCIEIKIKKAKQHK